MSIPTLKLGCSSSTSGTNQGELSVRTCAMVTVTTPGPISAFRDYFTHRLNCLDSHDIPTAFYKQTKWFHPLLPKVMIPLSLGITCEILLHTRPHNVIWNQNIKNVACCHLYNCNCSNIKSSSFHSNHPNF